ncbi:MAG TPA: methyltransferase domain-containing protein [Methylocella sp.]|nr:methyltransferase domain-containing protein [Methylocella sp.]
MPSAAIRFIVGKLRHLTNQRIAAIGRLCSHHDYDQIWRSDGYLEKFHKVKPQTIARNRLNLGEFGTHVECLRLAALLFSAPDVKRVMDVAAGSHWQFPIAYKGAYGLELSGVDIDADAVGANDSLDFRFVDDVCRNSRIGIGNYDLMTSYSGVEHFPDVQKFLETAFISLKPGLSSDAKGGALIAQFPSPLAPFAILNRLLPQGLKRKIINTLYSDKADELGYAVSYDKCRYSEF